MAVTAAQVRTIIVTGITDGEIYEFIADALANMTSEGIIAAPCHTAGSLDIVNKYLAAHMIASFRERQLTKEKIGKAEDTYGGAFGMGLDFTQYGQMAKTSDCSGILTSLGKTAVSFSGFGGPGG